MGKNARTRKEKKEGISGLSLIVMVYPHRAVIDHNRVWQSIGENHYYVREHKNGAPVIVCNNPGNMVLILPDSTERKRVGGYIHHYYGNGESFSIPEFWKKIDYNEARRKRHFEKRQQIKKLRDKQLAIQRQEWIALHNFLEGKYGPSYAPKPAPPAIPGLPESLTKPKMDWLDMMTDSNKANYLRHPVVSESYKRDTLRQFESVLRLVAGGPVWLF